LQNHWQILQILEPALVRTIYDKSEEHLSVVHSITDQKTDQHSELLPS